MRYKACPRCTGDCYVERGVGYTEWVCLQCGHRHDADRRLQVVSATRERRVGLGRRTAA